MSIPTTLAKLKYQAWHRGTKENDLLLGPYAETHLQIMLPDQLSIFTQFLNETDIDIFTWVVHKITPPPLYQKLVTDIIYFHDQK